MTPDLSTLSRLAKNAEPNTKKLFSKFKKRAPDKLDDTFHELHDEAFEHIDCLACANCCKTTSPIFYSKDIERAAAELRMKPSAFMDTYLKMDEDDDYVLKQSPCPFLDAENYCSIYEARPTACREYPHTNRKKMYQLLDLTLRNTHVCPAVYEVVEGIKKRFN